MGRRSRECSFHPALRSPRHAQLRITLGAEAERHVHRERQHQTWEAQEGFLEEGAPELSPKGGASQEWGEQRDLSRGPGPTLSLSVCLSVSVSLSGSADDFRVPSASSPTPPGRPAGEGGLGLLSGAVLCEMTVCAGGSCRLKLSPGSMFSNSESEEGTTARTTVCLQSGRRVRSGRGRLPSGSAGPAPDQPPKVGRP